jgi:hypothetical protein
LPMRVLTSSGRRRLLRIRCGPSLPLSSSRLLCFESLWLDQMLEL